MKVTDHVEMDRPPEEEWPSLKKDVEEMLEMRIANIEIFIINLEMRIVTVEKIAMDAGNQADINRQNILRLEQRMEETYDRMVSNELGIFKLKREMEIFLREMRGEGN